jgi:hypothetical protein
VARLDLEPKRISLEQVRQHKRFKDLSDQDALSLIESLERLSVILFEQDKNLKSKSPPT